MLTLTALAPLMRPGMFSGHDPSLRDIYRLAQLEKGIRSGMWFPRWQPDFYRGFGFPFFNFYQPLVYYIAFIFRLLGASYVTSLKLMIGTGIIGSAAAMYFCARTLWNAPGALAASVLYTYALYHLADIYVRGALAESFAFVFFPLILGSLMRLKSKRYGYMLSISIAGLMLCHNVETMLFLPVLAIAVLVLWLVSPRDVELKRVVISGLWGVAISSFFWVPALLERREVHIFRLTEAGYNPMIHFLYPVQLLGNVWGHDASGPGPEKFPFAQGWLMLLLIGGAAVSYRAMAPHARRWFMVVVACWIFFLCLTLSISSPFWAHIPLLRMAQFPWRALAPAAFAGALAAGGALEMLEMREHQAGAAVLVALLVLASQGRLIRALGYQVIPDASVTSEAIRRRGGTTTASNEYLPRWVSERRFLKEVLHVIPGQPAPSFSDLPPISPDGTTARIMHVQEEGRRLVFDAKCESPVCKVCLNTFYFPGWYAKIPDGGRSLSLGPTDLGLIGITVPRGRYRVAVAFGKTPIRLTVEIISFAAFIALICSFFLSCWRRR